MPASKTFHGARAQLIIAPPGQAARVVGIFSSVSFGLQFDVNPVYLLGRFSADELVYTGMAPVKVTATGWKVIGAGPHVVAGLPTLDQLLTADYLELAIYDRQTDQRVAQIHSVRCEGYSTTINARELDSMSVSFVGLLIDDESAVNQEAVGASTLP